jgi:broad specificity phosphatase PhoE
MKRTLLASRILAAAVAFALPSALLAQKAVFAVRHAEKASDANEASVPLSTAGTDRARKLAAMLKDAGITAIYSTDTVRTKTTAEPLAAARKLSIQTYDFPVVDGKPNLSPLAEKLRRDHSQDVVLVVGHSNTIAPLLAALGCRESVSIAGDEYDNLFVVVPQGSGTPLLLRLRF